MWFYKEENINWEESGMLHGLDGKNKNQLSALFNFAIDHIKKDGIKTIIVNNGDKEIKMDSYYFPSIRRVYDKMLSFSNINNSDSDLVILVDPVEIINEVNSKFKKIYDGLSDLKSTDIEAEALSLLCNNYCAELKEIIKIVGYEDYIKNRISKLRESKINNLLDLL